ncbi:MAG: PAS domain S-box protein [Methylophagaceae bacterium]
MENFFTPAIRLLNRLRYPQKLALLSSIVILIIILLTAALYQQLNKVIADSKIQLEGIDKIVAVNNLIQFAQQSRGYSAANSQTGVSFTVLHNEKELETEAAFLNVVSSLDPTMSLLTRTGDLEKLNNLWEQIKAENKPEDKESKFNLYISFIRKLQLLTGVMADHYLLLTDADLSSHYMVEMLVENIPATTESIGKIRGGVLEALSSKKLSEDNRQSLFILEAALTQSTNEFGDNISKVIHYSPEVASELSTLYSQLKVEQQQLLKLLDSDIYSERFETISIDFWTETTDSIDKLYSLMRKPIASSLKAHLKLRLDHASLMLNTAIVITTLLFLFILYFVIALYKASLTNLNHIYEAVNDYSRGNLDTRIKLNTQDEIRDISISINEMADELVKSQQELLFRQRALDDHAIVSISDVKGKIIYVNKKFEKVSKYSLDELMGQDHRLLKSDFHPDSFFIDMWRTIANGNIWHGEIKNRAKDGSIYWVSSTIAPYLNKNGKPDHYFSVRTDITHLKELEIEQQQETKRLDTIIDIAMDASIQMDDKGVVIGWNTQAEHIFGWSKKQAIGSQLHTLIIPEKYHEQHIAGFKRCLMSGESTLFSTPVEITAINNEGTEFPIEIAVSLVEIDGRYEFAGFIRDLTKQKEYEDSIIEAKEAANQANKAKSDFLSSMSHELRTPLNSIIGFAQLLQNDEDVPLTEDQLESMGFILSSGNHLLKLINGILELSAIEAGKTELLIKSMSLLEVINETVSLLMPLANEVDIKIQVLSDIDVTVSADETKLKQIILNLISNAIKYNREEGSVTLTWEVTNEMVKINVIDTGIGIAHAYEDKVFSPFNRLGQEVSTIEGTGIGLVVTQELVELMNGSIGFESVENKGTTFWFELPVA